MTNTKPTWEEEWEKLEKKYDNKGDICGNCERFCCGCEICECCERMNPDIIKAFIQKVHDEAYERGKSDGQEEEAILWRQSHL